MMNSEKVREFHEKYDFKTGLRLSQSCNIEDTRRLLLNFADQLETMSLGVREDGILYQEHGDPRLYRAHLILEEVGELLQALAEGDEVETSDALADLLYVVYGTALTYGIPINEIFAEVHRSNMTKTRTTSDTRMKRKGKGYEKPEISRILSEHGMGEARKNSPTGRRIHHVKKRRNV